MVMGNNDNPETTGTADLGEQAAADPQQTELQTLKQERDSLYDRLLRNQAEFENYKKRVEKEQAQTYQQAAGNILKRYLEILDDLERALKNAPGDGEGKAWANGIELITNKLRNILESEGIKPLEAEGQSFDPNLHEAVTLEESSQHESGQIIEVLEQGYVIGDRVLRPARVRVAR